MENEHPWITEGLDTGEIEVVLVAPDTLPEWDVGATTRAFQTYLWSNASTGGDHVSFVHDETGVIVCHDGNVVGIECGHGSLREALPDLISVLHSLGWRGALVYCLEEHMHEVLSDIGRGLPANLDFDVREAKRGTLVSDMPEAQLLLDHSREVLRAAAETGDAMDNTTLEVWRSLKNPSSSAVTGPINLVDDDDMEGGAELFIAPALTGGIPSNPPLRDLVDLEDSDGPRVFEFLGTTMLLPRDAEQAPMEVPPTTLLCPVVAEMAPSPLPSIELTARQRMEERPVLQATAERQGTEKLEVASVNVPEITNRAQATGGDLLQVGKSAFYFLDQTFKLPAESIAEDMGLAPNQLVVHLWPGAVRQTVRWDALGEIDLNYPLFAQTWARWAFPDCDSAVNVAEAVLQLRAGAAGLRELGIQMSTDATVQNALAALRLVRPGEAFVDWQSTEDMGDGVPEEEQQEVFTVREVMLSHVPRLYIVHIDALDGAFVQWIIGLLHQVINGYSNSGWVSRQMLSVEPATPEQAETPSTQSTALNHEVTALVGGLLEKLRELGIDVTPRVTER